MHGIGPHFKHTFLEIALDIYLIWGWRYVIDFSAVFSIFCIFLKGANRNILIRPRFASSLCATEKTKKYGFYQL